MKLILLAAAAAIAMPALAQQQTTSNTGQPSTGGVQGAPTTNPEAANSTPAGEQATAPMQQGSMAQGSAAQGSAGQSMPMSSSTTTGDPVGGYQPAAPAMSGPMQPGATVTYQQAPSPDQAYPAPAPLAKYPICKPGQFDKCMQGKGSTHSRQVHRRR